MNTSPAKKTIPIINAIMMTATTMVLAMMMVGSTSTCGVLVVVVTFTSGVLVVMVGRTCGVVVVMVGGIETRGVVVMAEFVKLVRHFTAVDDVSLMAILKELIGKVQ